MNSHCAPSIEGNGEHVVNIEDNNPSTWGDKMTPHKDENTIRIVLQNVNGIGYDDTNIWKTEKIMEFMKKDNLDALLMTEINVNWKKVKRRHSLQFLTKIWFENSCAAIAYNQIAKRAPIGLPGGTAIVIQGETALRKIKNNNDNKRLGRWSSTMIRGKDGMNLRFVAVYVPCIAQTYGEKKVYCQQQKALLSMGIKRQVMDTFWKDFWTQIDEWLDKGDNLIIGGDWNHDVRKDDFLQDFKNRNLIPAVINKHGINGPETYNRGRSPIDEIFVSSTMVVQKAGYLEHGEGLGDHRPIWIEVTKQSALGVKLPKPTSFSARRLKCKDPRIVQRYNKLLEEELQKHDVFNRTNKLFQRFSNPMTKKQIQEYEKIDNIREAAMIYAEKHCRRLYMGGVKWSPQVTSQRVKIDYLKACISRRKGTKINTRTLIRKSRKAKFDASGMDMYTLSSMLDKAFKEYKRIKQQHVQARQSYLEDLAEALSETGNVKKATHLRNLIRIEEQRELYKKLKYITGKANNLGTTFVTIQDDEGIKKDIVDKEEMEKAIINENKKKYHQTERTCPFIYDDQLRKDFGEHGEGNKTKALFQGKYKIPAHVDKYTSAFIQTCRQKKYHKKASFERNEEMYKRSWEKMDERISSRRLHFGHFKAACKSKDIINLHYKMAEIPFRTGYDPKRWRNATNVMILKKVGLYDIDRLRTIVLYEADFNHNNKYFGKHMMQHTINQNMLSKEQYSIPGRKAVDHALNRRLIFDIIRYKKSSLAMTSCDLKSCYDRIAHAPAYLAMTGYKYLSGPLISMFRCIQNMEWVTRTAHGDSRMTFGGSDQEFIAKPQGVGQGNGSGPSVWAVVSSRMFEVLHNQGLATTFEAPISKSNATDLCGFAFVDDSDIIAGANNTNNPQETIKNMQKTIDWWEGVAKTTGGALEPTKSWWYLIYFEWNNGQWKYGEKNLNDKLTAFDKNNERVNLQNIPVSKTQTMLGVDLAPNGDNTSQVQLLKEKTKKMGELIRVGSLTHNEAWIALQTMAIKTVEYPLPASTFTKEEIQSIIWPILKHYLPKSGINRNISRDVLFGPIRLGGLGVHDPFVTQGINHITDMIDHLWNNTLTGKLIQHSIEQLRIEIGSNCNIFEEKINKYEHILLTKSWIRHTWKFMTQYNLQLIIHTHKFQKRRQHDTIMMEKILQIHTLSKTERRDANKCRIYLRAVSIADITTGDGKRISDFAMKGYQNNRQTRSDIEWPLWGKPAEKEWKSWCKAIRLAYCTRKEGELDKPLGAWTETISDDWEWFENMFDEKLYQREKRNGTWKTYEPIGRSHRRKRFNNIGYNIGKPNKGTILIPTTVTTAVDYYKGEGINAIIPIDENNNNQHTHPPLPWLHQSCTQTENLHQLIQEIKDGTAIAVSDGSYCPERQIGSAAWTIQTTTTTSPQYLRGTSISPGSKEIQNAYRSELLGLLGILDALKVTCDYCELKRGKLTMACDGISALEQIQREADKISCKWKQCDLISACIKLRQEIPIDICFQHVKGHQDESNTYEELTILEKANIWADDEAKTTLESFWRREDTTIYNSSPLHPLAFPTVLHKGDPIRSQVNKALYTQITSTALHNYWIKKGRYTNDNKSEICWMAYKHAMRNSSLTRRRFIAKWNAEFIGTGKNMTRWGLRLEGKCPFCLQDDENILHILQCTHHEAHTAWDKAMITWFKSLIQIGIDTTTIKGIRDELILWKEGSNDSCSSGDEQIDKLLTSQRKLGWKQFMEGLLSNQWYNLLITNNDYNRYKVIAIMSKIIRANWEFIFNIWTERNSKLHDTDRIKEFEGRPDLIEAIKNERRIGISRLPHNDFGYLFTMKEDTLFSRSLEGMKDWLAIIRGGRELHNDPKTPQDQFSRQGPLREWIGLKTTTIYSE